MSLRGFDHILSTVLLAICANLDNFGVGLAYGVSRRGIRPGHNLLIAVMSGSGTLLSMTAGEWVNDFMSEALANVLGGAILIAIGVYSSARAVLRGERVSSPIARTTMSAREALVLAVSLTLNNLASGLGAGISHVDIFSTAALTAAVSMVAISLGHLLGRRTVCAISHRGLGVTAGMIFVLVGVYELFV